METQSLHFWTTGEQYTNLLLEMFMSGKFKAFEEMLKGGNFGHDQNVLAFQLKLQLIGSTKEGGDLSATFLEESPKTYLENLITGIRSAMSNTGKGELIQGSLLLKLDFFEKHSEDIQTLLKYITKESLIELYWEEILEDEGFGVGRSLLECMEDSNQTISGLLLTDGTFVQCGYQDHRSLFPLLLQLGKVESFDRDDHLSSDALPISSNMISGSKAYTLEHGGELEVYQKGEEEKFTLTDRQLEELWKVRDFKIKSYTAHKSGTVMDAIRRQFVQKQGMGGKYGNLKFLEKFYPEIKICEFYKTYLSFEPRKMIVRTSPNKSLPGLLNSVVCGSAGHIKEAIKKIRSDFEKHRDVRRDNEINWFYQTFLEGQNGVVNCFEKHTEQRPKERGGLTAETQERARWDIQIACSTEQGAIVQGHTTNVELSSEESSYLRKLSRKIAKDLDSDIQLEFVKVAENDIRIVQMRTLEKPPRTSFQPSDENLKAALVIGKSFCSAPEHGFGNSEVNVKDILIVEQDSDSEALLGKKALIVKNDTTFSHILALSKALGIPSIYATGEVDFQDAKVVRFSTEYQIGFIKKLS